MENTMPGAVIDEVLSPRTTFAVVEIATGRILIAVVDEDREGWS